MTTTDLVRQKGCMTLLLARDEIASSFYVLAVANYFDFVPILLKLHVELLF